MEKKEKKAKNGKLITWKAWSAEEDAAIIKALRENPDNFDRAFSMVSVTLERSKSACSSRWYRVLKFREDTVYYTVSERKYGRNTRIMKEDTNSDKSPFRMIWEAIKKIFE